MPTQPYPGAHFATFPPKLVEPCLKAGCPVGGTVLDPFWGAGTVGVVAQDLHLKAIGIELNADYIDLSTKRLAQGVLPFGDAK
ncbi:MAG TPA: site-specific DNA-methyltransferase [Sumerlaeia bacterium]|nr:site-specific DNA-methyltransferase [Sumerlaeia bacterium]